MRFNLPNSLPRPADSVDLSTATTAKRTGPAVWAEPGWLEIPFDRELTPAEVSAVTALLTAPTNAVATWRRQVEDYLALATPSTAQNAAVIKILARLVLDALNRRG